VVSSKSWLSHDAVDRRAAILPWRLDASDDEELERISPVEASTLLLRHLRRAWDDAHPHAPLHEQDVVLTVPASFDAVARQLTVEAAVQAGLHVRLLEEPQAAFYDFMRRGGDEALEHLLGERDETSVLVLDIGGGTTDLSLIRVRRDDAGLEVRRIAVGHHLLLGGDNMDLALAHLLEPRLVGEGDHLAPRRFAQLVAACRQGKQRLLADDAPDEVPISLVRAGSKLVGGALRTSLRRDEARRVVLEGFLPEVDLDTSRKAMRAGIVAFGLPYERDVAITRHLAEFLRRHRDEAGLPSAMLLNGGVFHAEPVVDRVHAVLASWIDGLPLALPVADPDTAVALGAVAYGQALRRKGRRIGGGSARGYYLALGGEPPRAVSVLPRGIDEGHPVRASDATLELTVGRPVRFELLAAEEGGVDPAGAVVPIDDERHKRLPPLVATLQADDERSVRVQLEAELSAIGTLELACVSVDDGADERRFALAFELRGAVDEAPASRAVTADASARHGKRLEQIDEALRRVYGKRSQNVPLKDVKGLWRSLEKICGKRRSWPADLNRAVFDRLWSVHKGRRRSPDHERLFWSIAGFCLRPGFGDPRDAERCAALWRLFDQRLAHAKELKSWQQFWIAWRRIAGGLDEERQVGARDVLHGYLAPSEKKLKKVKAYRNEATFEMLDLAASLERASAERRAELGSWIVERTWTDRDPRLWAALGRVGARIPIYASAHHAVSARTVERWIDHLLREKWEQVPTAPRAVVAMCRVTGDRSRDVAERTRNEVLKRLARIGADDELARPVRELVAVSDRDRSEFYGDDLPVGLHLVDEP
jgi:hypothetical protein